MRYREFEPSRFAETRRRLIREKGDDFQRAFLAALLDRSDFDHWLDEHLVIVDGEGHEPPCCREKITEEEFRQPTVDVERMAFDSWTGLTPREACRPSFWGYSTVTHIRQEIIEPHWLALNGRPEMSGRRRIGDALDGNDPVKVDDVTRTILRRLSGLPEARGGLRSVSVDCTLARAWWREHLARQVVEVAGADDRAVSRVLRLSQTYWEKLVTMIVSRNTVLGDDRVRSVLVGALAGRFDDTRYAELLRPSGLDRCVRMIGVLSAWQELGVFDVDELGRMIGEDVFADVLALPDGQAG